MKLAPFDIAQTDSVASIVFGKLRKAILDGTFVKGSQLRQDEIAKTFNISRIPVREAISRLEEQGLVKIQRYKGAFVVGIEPDEVSEIFDFRALLESQVIALAVPNLTDPVLAEARRCCDAFSNSSAPMQWHDLNLKFHRTLYGAGELPYHLRMIDQAMERTDRFVRAQLTMTDGMARANRDHLEILEACIAGDAQAAAERTRHHIIRAKDTLIEQLKVSELG